MSRLLRASPSPTKEYESASFYIHSSRQRLLAKKRALISTSHSAVQTPTDQNTERKEEQTGERTMEEASKKATSKETTSGTTVFFFKVELSYPSRCSTEGAQQIRLVGRSPPTIRLAIRNPDCALTSMGLPDQQLHSHTSHLRSGPGCN